MSPPYITVDKKAKVATYWFDTSHKHEHCSNKCLYEDRNGILRCSYLENEAKKLRKRDEIEG